MESDVFVLAAGGIVTMVICATIVIVFGVVIFLFVRGARRTATAFATQPAQQGEDFLNAAQLRQWDDSAWADLSSRWEGWWRDFTRPGHHEGYTQGVVRSFKDPSGPGWLAFTLQRQQVRRGTLILKTSEQRFELQVSARSPLDKDVQVQVLVDGAQTGTIAVTYPTCAYRSADGTIEARWTAEIRWNNERFFGNRLTSREVHYDDLVVNGRRIAALADTWVRYPHSQTTKPFHPALQSVADSLDREERQVLFVALGMALYYDSLRNRRYMYDW